MPLEQNGEELLGNADGDGKAHGVFTTALLAGLNGAAADAATGEVSAKTLREYLINYMKDYFAPEDRLNPTSTQSPIFRTWTTPVAWFCQLTPPTYPITSSRVLVPPV
jgi:hypothetical protein